ncbi:hypothetical protein ES703_101228 [subsurface metagenome]
MSIGTVHHGAVARRNFTTSDQVIYLVDDKLGFFLLVIGLHDGRRHARLILRPQVLRFALLVGGDDVRRCLQNYPGRAIVLLQQNYLCLRVVLLKVKDVAQVSKPPGVNRLVRVANHTDIAILPGQLLHQLVLYQIGILKLVYLQVQVTRLVFSQELRVLAEQIHHLHQQIIEVQGITLGK